MNMKINMKMKQEDEKHRESCVRWRNQERTNAGNYYFFFKKKKERGMTWEV
jgi:hypothetical protein